jgi:FKBP-type peptidyl-prolyl cis-trans isomerase SlyD
MSATVVSIKYDLKDQDGNMLDSSNGEPFSYLQGHHNIIPGLEKALTGTVVGSKKQVVVEPEEAYGIQNPQMVFDLNKAQFQGGDIPPIGEMVQMGSPEGQNFMGRISKIEGDVVTVDANHPLAGQTLYFDVEVVELRPATEEELQHGHPHGVGGHHH